MSTEKLITPDTTDNSFSLTIKWHPNSNFCLVLKGSCLKQKNATYTPPNRIKCFIVYELDTWSWDLNTDFILKDCLFEGVKLVKNADSDKYVYTGYGSGFDSCSVLSLPDGSTGKNAIILGVDKSSSEHIDNKKKDILILGFGQTQGLDDILLTAEAQCSINFSRSNRKFCLNLHYNGSNSFLFVNPTKIYQSKAKDSEIKKYPLCLGNISGDFSANNIKRQGLNGCVYNFSVDYRAFKKYSRGY